MQVLPPGDILRISMLQHAGRPAITVVRPGEQVSAGQLLGRADGAHSAPVHAPCAGVVEGIESAPNLLPAAPDVAHVRLRCGDAPDSTMALLPPLDIRKADAESLRSRVSEAGIVGLGGGGFPTARKLGGSPRTLILNGVECEPHIACDDRLLRERAVQVVCGGGLLARAWGIDQVVIALEASMREAVAAVRTALIDQPGIELCVLPDRYPQGGERQLILAVCGQEVPRGGLPQDIGVCVVNVGTAHAVYQAVAEGRALTRRWISISGSGIRQPGVFEVPIGTPLRTLVEAAGGYTDREVRVLVGGSMMGLPMTDDRLPLGKLHNAITVFPADALASPVEAMPCIRCGACAEVCPSRLLPQDLHRHACAGDGRRLEQSGVFDCIECGCCDVVCPSHIPLTRQFRAAKHAVMAERNAQQRAEAARGRFEARQARLARDSELRAHRRATRQQASNDPVQAALARARARLASPAEPDA